MGSAPAHEEEDLGWEWLKDDEEKMKKVKEVISGITETRRKLFTEPYCRELCLSFFLVLCILPEFSWDSLLCLIFDENG